MRGTCERVDEILKKDPALPKIGKEYLRKLRSGEITMQEFDREIAYWMMNYIEDMRWRPEPTPPTEIVELRRQLAVNQNYKVAPAFWQQEHIKAYGAQVHAVLSTNKGNYYWLKQLSRDIPEDDVSAHAKIRRIKLTYPAREVMSWS